MKNAYDNEITCIVFCKPLFVMLCVTFKLEVNDILFELVAFEYILKKDTPQHFRYELDFLNFQIITNYFNPQKMKYSL